MNRRLAAFWLTAAALSAPAHAASNYVILGAGSRPCEVLHSKSQAR